MSKCALLWWPNVMFDVIYYIFRGHRQRSKEKKGWPLWWSHCKNSRLLHPTPSPSDGRMTEVFCWISAVTLVIFRQPLASLSVEKIISEIICNLQDQVDWLRVGSFEPEVPDGSVLDCLINVKLISVRSVEHYSLNITLLSHEMNGL